MTLMLAVAGTLTKPDAAGTRSLAMADAPYPDREPNCPGGKVERLRR